MTCMLHGRFSDVRHRRRNRTNGPVVVAMVGGPVNLDALQEHLDLGWRERHDAGPVKDCGTFGHGEGALFQPLLAQPESRPVPGQRVGFTMHLYALVDEDLGRWFMHAWPDVRGCLE